MIFPAHWSPDLRPRSHTKNHEGYFRGPLYVFARLRAPSRVFVCLRGSVLAHRASVYGKALKGQRHRARPEVSIQVGVSSVRLQEVLCLTAGLTINGLHGLNRLNRRVCISRRSPGSPVNLSVIQFSTASGQTQTVRLPCCLSEALYLLQLRMR